MPKLEEASIVAPIPQIMEHYLKGAVHLMNSEGKWRSGRSGSAELGRFLARCSLTTKLRGYSQPSLVGIDSGLLARVNPRCLFGDHGVGDFWAYMAKALPLVKMLKRGETYNPELVTWFDLDSPNLLKAFYDFLAIPDERDLIRGLNLEIRDPDLSNAHAASNHIINSSVEIGRERSASIVLRNCTFDHSTVCIEMAHGIESVTLEGLVVVGSNVTLHVRSPVVRHVLVHGASSTRQRPVCLDLDYQLVTSSMSGNTVSSPLMLVDYLNQGWNELLRCPLGSLV